MAKTPVSRVRLNTAFQAVQTELAFRGLWGPDSRLRKVDVYWCDVPTSSPDIAAFFLHEASSEDLRQGLEAGHIYVPWRGLQRGGRVDGHLRYLLRHEFGHAVAHHYPALVRRARRFRDVFGGPYDSTAPIPGEPRDFLSEYAASEPAEDWAETFGAWLRTDGRCPTGGSSRFRQKWMFVRDVARKISRHQVRP